MSTLPTPPEYFFEQDRTCAVSSDIYMLSYLLARLLFDRVDYLPQSLFQLILHGLNPTPLSRPALREFKRYFDVDANNQALQATYGHPKQRGIGLNFFFKTFGHLDQQSITENMVLMTVINLLKLFPEIRYNNVCAKLLLNHAMVIGKKGAQADMRAILVLTIAAIFNDKFLGGYALSIAEQRSHNKLKTVVQLQWVLFLHHQAAEVFYQNAVETLAEADRAGEVITLMRQTFDSVPAAQKVVTTSSRVQSGPR